MISPARCTPEAARALAGQLGLPGDVSFDALEVEFREIPYFIVSRSRATWDQGAKGDINAFEVLSVGQHGMLVNSSGEQSDQRFTLIPWANVISITVKRS